MHDRLTHLLAVLCLASLTVSLAGPLRITDVRVEGSNLSLSWTHLTNLYIVAQSSSLATGQFQFVDSVQDSPHAVLPRTNASSFYRVRQVETVPFPDPSFRAAVNAAIPRKYAPTNDIYDIDLAGLTELIAVARGITNATGIGRLKDLAYFYCLNNNLGSLDLSSNANLIRIECAYNKLSSLDLSANTNLTDVGCGHNSLTALDLSANTWLTWLACEANGLSSLDLSHQTRLVELYCSHNSLISLDLSTHSNLTRLECDFNNLTTLALPATSNLTWLVCSGNHLATLNLSASPGLTWLFCNSNNLTRLDLSANTKLAELHCFDNSLTNIDLSANTNATYVDCRNNPLAQIIVSDTNHLPATFLYSGNPVIRQP